MDEIFSAVPLPLADPSRYAEAFHRGHRLVALDGTRFNLRNTPAINAEAVKVPCGKGGGEPAFAHLLGVVLVEVGLHQPLAAAFGWRGEGQLTLARRILARGPPPDRCLLPADRLFGTPRCCGSSPPCSNNAPEPRSSGSNPTSKPPGPSGSPTTHG